MLIGVPSIVRLRRIFLLAARPGKGQFTQPTAGVQAGRLELVFMPRFGHWKIRTPGR